MAEPLLDAVHKLTDVVSQLQETLDKDYPKRVELERDYISVHQGKQRRKEFVILIALAVVFAYFSTISTISYCFIGASNADSGSDTRFGCRVVPGYAESQENGRQLIAQFRELQEIVIENQQKLIELQEKRVTR